MVDSSSEWLQIYQQTIHEQYPTYSSFRNTGILASNYYTGSADSRSSSRSATAKANRVHKPIRRRSRASKKTPTTLLKAKPADFRALVQRFTGRPNRDISFGCRQRGPLNLNFQLGRVQNHCDSSTVMAPVGYYQQQFDQMQCVVEQQQRLQIKEQSCLNPKDSTAVRSDSQYFPTLSESDSTPNLHEVFDELLDELFMEDFPPHELTGESFPADDEDFF